MCEPRPFEKDTSPAIKATFKAARLLPIELLAGWQFAENSNQSSTNIHVRVTYGADQGPHAIQAATASRRCGCTCARSTAEAGEGSRSPGDRQAPDNLDLPQQRQPGRAGGVQSAARLSRGRVGLEPVRPELCCPSSFARRFLSASNRSRPACFNASMRAAPPGRRHAACSAASAAFQSASSPEVTMIATATNAGRRDSKDRASIGPPTQIPSNRKYSGRSSWPMLWLARSTSSKILIYEKPGRCRGFFMPGKASQLSVLGHSRPDSAILLMPGLPR